MPKPRWPTSAKLVQEHGFPKATPAQGVGGWGGILDELLELAARTLLQEFGPYNATAAENKRRDKLISKIWHHETLGNHFNDDLYDDTVNFLRVKISGKKSDLKLGKGAKRPRLASSSSSSESGSDSSIRAVAKEKKRKKGKQPVKQESENEDESSDDDPAPKKENPKKKPKKMKSEFYVREESEDGGEAFRDEPAPKKKKQKKEKRSKLSPTDDADDLTLSHSQSQSGPGRHRTSRGGLSTKERPARNLENDGLGMPSIDDMAPSPFGDNSFDPSMPSSFSGASPPPPHSFHSSASHTSPVRQSIEQKIRPFRVFVALLNTEGKRLYRCTITLPGEPGLTFEALSAKVRAKGVTEPAFTGTHEPHMVAMSSAAPGRRTHQILLTDDDECAQFQECATRNTDESFTIFLCAGPDNIPIWTFVPLVDAATEESHRPMSVGLTNPSGRIRPPTPLVPTIQEGAEASTSLNLDAPQPTLDASGAKAGPESTTPPPAKVDHEMQDVIANSAATLDGTQDATAKSDAMAEPATASHSLQHAVTPLPSNADGVTADLEGGPSSSAMEASEAAATAADRAARSGAADPSLPAIEFVDTVSGQKESFEEFGEEALERLTSLTRDATAISKLTKDNVRRYCHFMGRDLRTWDPQAVSDSLCMKGVAEHQCFTTFWMAETEGSKGFECEDDSGGTLYQSVGGTVAHDPGTGKTRSVASFSVWIGVCVVMVREIKDHPEQHCQGDRTVCPMAAQQMERFGHRCLCEPQNEALRRAVRDGASVVIAPPNLIHVWNVQLKTVDFERYKDLTGTEFEVLVAHRQNSRLGRKNFAKEVARWVPKTPTLRQWCEANPLMSDEEVSFAITKGEELTEPYIAPATVNNLVVLTTPGSFSTQFADHATIATFHPITKAYPCRKDTRSCIVNPRTCKAHNHTHNGKAAPQKIVFPVRFFGGDESHTWKGRNTVISNMIRAHIQQTTCAVTTFWNITGTPMSVSPTDLVHLFRTQEFDNWREVEWLAPFAGTAGDDMMALDVQFLGSRARGTVPKPTVFSKHVGHAIPMDPTTKTVDNNKARKEWLAAWETGVIDPVKTWTDNFMIQFKTDDKFDDKPLVDLPPTTRREIKTRLPGDYLPTVIDLISDYRSRSDRIIQLRAGIDAQTTKASGAKERDEKLQFHWRYLLLIISVPALHTFLAGNLDIVRADYVNKNNFWENPEQHELYAHAEELLQSSPKLQQLVRELDNRPYDTTKVQYFEEDLTEEPLETTITHQRKTVLAFYDPALAIVAWLILHKRFKSQLLEPKEKMGCIRGCADPSDVVRRFQLDLPEGGPPSPSLDLIVMNNRVGGLGITLSRCRTMYAVDVDPSPARKIQVPARMRRRGQEHPTTFVEMITEDFGIDETTIDLRDKGKEYKTRLLHSKAPDIGVKDAKGVIRLEA